MTQRGFYNPSPQCATALRTTNHQAMKTRRVAPPTYPGSFLMGSEQKVVSVGVATIFVYLEAEL